MKTHSPRKHSLPATSTWWAAPAAFLATLLALPVNAGIVVPDLPLTTGNRVAPNILFILDDSGSMADDEMPNEAVGSICRRRSNGSCYDNTAITGKTYVGNTLYYNPAVTYQPWMRADGNRRTGGTTYTAVYGSRNLAAGGTINLAQATSCRYYNNNTGTTPDEGVGNQVCGGEQTFWVPINPAESDRARLKEAKNYYRYTIASDGTAIQRAEYGDTVITDNTPPDQRPAGYPLSVPETTSNVSPSGSMEHVYQVTVPAGSWSGMVVTLSGGTHGSGSSHSNGSGDGANLYVAGSSAINTGNYLRRSRKDGNNEDITISSPVGGSNFWIGVDRDSSFGGVMLDVRFIAEPDVTSNRCDGSITGSGETWINCSATLPNASRTFEQEKINYATWFSYHRTRMKAAKAGASEAFRSVDSKARVGFRTIHARGANHSAPIPVAQGDGRFINDTALSISNRGDWYDSLHAAIGYSGTPLQSALDAAGTYFSSDAAGGPYGPETGRAQLSCRQNFTILTTDGYWNGGIVRSDNEDNTQGATIMGPNGRSYRYQPTAPYSDSYAGTLADVAMRYWKTDLRQERHMGNTEYPDNNNVPTTDANPAFWQHMVTFGISIGLKTSSGKSSVDDVNSSTVWPDPELSNTSGSAAVPARIDDLLHAAVNGRGAFVSAANPAEFTAGLSEALAAIAQRTSSFSNVATNAASIRTGGKVFNASYVSGLWTGTVRAWNLDANNNPGTLAWEASVPAHTGRDVFTFDGASGATFPTENQSEALERTGGPVDYPVTPEQNANYIKGDTSLEERNGGLLRNRTTVLGDIVGSSPAYVDETQTLYVGANDGMLHAFDATSGDELFAYVPNIINFGNLATLSRGDYTHKFFVDGPIAVSPRTLTSNRNFLIGALGKGGKGLYGLDVTSPGSFSASDVEWELADTPLNNMGLVMGRPVLARVKSGAVAAIVGNGVNSTNERAVLIVVNLQTGAVIREIDTGAGSTATPNGLSAPTAVLGPDGRTMAYAYAGDRLGNVWKFDMTDESPAAWTATRLFTARSNDGSGAVQPITSGVTVATDPRTYKRWVLFGTGSYVTTTEADDKTALTQSMYGFVDSDTVVGYSDLQKRNINNTGSFQNGYPVRTFDAQASLPTDKEGWFVNLPGNGERVVQDSQVVANILITASMIPVGDACEASGTGYINAVDAFTGTSAGKSFFDLDGDGVSTDTVIGGVPVGSVNFGVGMPTLPIFLDGKLVVGGTGGTLGSEKPGAGGIVRNIWGRVSWREVRAD